jgi:anaerobic selenocysteine-containing dehydrogenase
MDMETTNNKTEDVQPISWQEGPYTVTRSTAWSGPGCHEGCGVLLYVKKGKLVKVEGDPEHPFNQGMLCPRCKVLPETVYHPDRLKYPMKRVGERGEGKWERISWDEAYDTIEKRYKDISQEYGPWSIVGFRGTGRDTMWQEGRLLYAIGTPNETGSLSGNSCWAPRAACMQITLGQYCVPDYSQYFPDRYENPTWKVPETIVIWGCNPVISNPDWTLGSWVVECMKRGSKLIVVDPRLTWLAGRAKAWLQIRPGTDGALALGMLNVIIQEELYDKDFVEKWVHGFQEVAARAAEYPVERVAEITWIPREQIVKAARLYASSKPAAVHLGVSIDMQITGVYAVQSIVAMMSITGNLDVPGGNVMAPPPAGVYQPGAGGWGVEELSEEARKKLIGYEKYPLIQFGMAVTSPDMVQEQMRTGEPYPIKGAWIQATNPLACHGTDPRGWYEGFQNTEFVAAVDLFMTPTIMAVADIVLPAATYPEKNAVRACLFNLSTTNKAIENVGECKSDLEINLELGKRFNQKLWPWDTEEDVLDELLEPAGMTFQELQQRGPTYPGLEYRRHEKGMLRPDGEPGFATPTGKVELCSSALEYLGHSPLPYFEEPPVSPISRPDLYKDYPLVMITGVRTIFFHSEHRQIPSLREIHPDPTVEIHPETAADLGIADGDWVWIENHLDRIRQKAKVTPVVHPRMVSVDYGWWFPEKSGPEPSLFGFWEVNSSRLIEMGNVGETGFGAAIKSTLCKIYKVKEGEM